jgi:ATP-dependent 26S proteasome regulatory subunit
MEVGVRDYLKAGFPALFLPSVESAVAEDRVRKALVELGLTDIDFAVWKITTGSLIGKAGEPDRPGRKEKDDLLETLRYVKEAKKPVAAVFHNIRGFLNQPAVIQGIIDAVMAARLVGSHLCFVGPHCDFPIELKSLVAFVDCPLPTRAEIKERFREMVEAYRKDIEGLPKSKEEFDKLLTDAATAAVGLDSMGAENALALSLAASSRINLKLIQAQKEQEVRKSDVLEFIRNDESLDQVGGFDVFKKWVAKRARAFSEEAREYHLPYPKGVLFVGPAGTGKSLAAKAMGSYLGLPVLRMDMGRIFRSLVGESEAAIRLCLQVAEAVAPVILWMDEMDKGLAGMRGSGELDSGVTSRVVSTILTWRQETKYPVVLAGTANDVSTIPSMVYRKGRLDEVWATDLPTLQEREQILAIHLLKRHRDPKNFNVKLIAKSMDCFVGAEIEGVIEDAMFSAFDEEKEVTTNHILSSVKETVPQAERDSEEIKAIREWVSTRARLVGAGELVPVNGVRKVRTLNITKKGE